MLFVMICHQHDISMCREPWSISTCTVYPKEYAHGFVVLCFVVVMQSFIMNSHEVFIHIHQGCFAGSGAIVRLPQCQWSKPDGYGKISQCITTTKHSKAKTVCIFLGIYCIITQYVVRQRQTSVSKYATVHPLSHESWLGRTHAHEILAFDWCKVMGIDCILEKFGCVFTPQPPS